ncbi:MAG: GNAT family N-acetyltransferase [Nitrolancea sp.]
MIEIAPTSVTPALRALLPKTGYTYRRYFAVLDGTSGGRILSDDAATPNWVAVHELSSDGCLFLGGALTRDLVHKIIDALRRERTVTLGVEPNDPLLPLVPEPSREGHDMDFDDRDPSVDLEPLCTPPDDLRLARIEREIEPRCLWTPWMFVDGPTAVERGIGYCLLDGDVVASESYAGPEVNSELEIAVITRDGYRRRGLASIVAARTVLECERHGYRTWWNTSLDNIGSASIARSLGYRTERHYRTWAWDKA